MSQFIQAVGFGLVTSSIIALGAVGFTVQVGVTRVINLAYPATMTAAAYIAYLLNGPGGMSIWLALPLAAVGAAGIALLMERIVYRPFQRAGVGPVSLAMAGLALNIILANIILAIAGPNLQVYNISRENTFHVGPIEWTTREVVIMLLALGCMIALYAILRWTRLGKAMRATADDAGLAANSGINPTRVRNVAWALSGTLCGLCGVALALDTVTFSSTTADTFILLVVAAALVGGIGDPYGAMLGALAIGLITDVAAIFTTTLNELVAFAFLVVLMLIRPNGLRGGRPVDLLGDAG